MWRSHYFTSSAAGADPPDLVHITYRSFIESDSFSFSCIDAVCVVAVLGKTTSNATGLDGILYWFSSDFFFL
jgi:hypothetical protein